MKAATSYSLISLVFILIFGINNQYEYTLESLSTAIKGNSYIGAVECVPSSKMKPRLAYAKCIERLKPITFYNSKVQKIFALLVENSALSVHYKKFRTHKLTLKSSLRKYILPHRKNTKSESDSPLV